MSDQTKKTVYINRENFTDKIKSYLRHPGSMILMFLVMLATFITFALLLFLIFYILINGIPHIKSSLFSLHYTSDNASVIPALINTVVMTLLSLLIAVPFGIFSAIFLVEYAGKGNKFIEVIRLTTETLSGIPSIVYGLFGMLFFVNTLKWGFSVLAGAFTLSIMILPLIMRQTEEALKETTSQIVEAVHSELEKTPPELAADVADRGIVLTGGGALLRGLEELIEEKTGINTMTAEEPMTCVAIGTGKFVEFLAGKRDDD